MLNKAFTYRISELYLYSETYSEICAFILVLLTHLIIIHGKTLYLSHIRRFVLCVTKAP